MKNFDFNSLNYTTLIMSAVGIYCGGLLTYILRNVPLNIWNFIKRYLTTELVLTSFNISFHQAIIFFNKLLKDKNYRTIKLHNGKWGENENTYKSLGYSFHWIWYKKTLLYVKLEKEESNQTYYDKERLIIKKLGRSHKIFDQLIEDINSKGTDKQKLSLYKRDDKRWNFINKQTKRSLDSMFLENEKKNLLLTFINDFINKENWYIQKGIPYHIGILLYGPPGTGKSSLIKVVSSYLGYDIYYLSTSNLIDLENAVAQLPNKVILVIEDIDSCPITHQRRNKEKEETSITSEYLEGAKEIGLSEILNSLDGLFSTHGRIMFMTTNYIEKLDSALIRPGRIDLKLNIDYVKEEVLSNFLVSFFPNEKFELTDLNLKKDLTVAYLQNLVLLGKTSKEIIELSIEKGI